MRGGPESGTGGVADQSVAQGFVQLPKRQIVLTMIGVLLALFLSALDQTIVATAMPRIIADLGGFDRFTWVTTAYLVASTTAVPIVGRLTDIHGRKVFYVAGITVFLVGSVLAGMSQTMNQLIAFRAIQGLGGGVIMVNSFTAIADLFPPETRGKYQGFVGVVFGMSSVIGPTLGGFITDNLSWNWVFFVNIPIGVPVLVLIALLFPSIRPEVESRKHDYPGMVTLVLAVVPVLLALSWGGVQYGWVSPQVIGMLVFGLTMAAVFITIESRTDSPIMPLEIYRNPMVSVSLVIVFLTGFGMFGGIIFIPLFFQGVLGASATSSGSFLTPMMLGIVVGATISGQLLSRTGLRYRRLRYGWSGTDGCRDVPRVHDERDNVIRARRRLHRGHGRGTRHDVPNVHALGAEHHPVQAHGSRDVCVAVLQIGWRNAGAGPPRRGDDQQVRRQLRAVPS